VQNTKRERAKGRVVKEIKSVLEFEKKNRGQYKIYFLTLAGADLKGSGINFVWWYFNVCTGFKLGSMPFKPHSQVLAHQRI